jgi:hypothetical protein
LAIPVHRIAKRRAVNTMLPMIRPLAGVLCAVLAGLSAGVTGSARACG